MSAVLDVVVFNPTHNTSYIRLIQDFLSREGSQFGGVLIYVSH